jgi:sugar transferase EpsL
MMKRILDIFLATLALLILSPLIFILSILVSLKLGNPIFFRQVRPGVHGKPFKMFKFRTMTNDRDNEGNLLPNHLRMTSFGQKLRALSLDELPELINVVKGDMSLVGPRPLLMDYVPLYSEPQKKRMDVRPGVTGWAQVNGRNAISWQEKFELDVWYVENQNNLLDLKILLLTVLKVIKRDGINHGNGVAMPRFTGNL